MIEMPHIVFLDGYTLNPGDLSWQSLEALGAFTVYDRTSPEQVIARAKEADILIVNKTALRAKHLQALPKLRYIGIAATGSDAIDVTYAKERGITVTNIPNYSTPSVAQMVIAFLLHVYSHVDTFGRSVQMGEWNRSTDFCFWKNPIQEVFGKRIGIVGMGNIGHAVARIAHAMGMHVYAFTSKEQTELPTYISKCSLEELWGTSDVITLHCPYNPSTHHLINAQSLSLMQPNTVLINTARGRLIDEEALSETLHAGKIQAYCADVLSQEPPIGDNPLLAAPRTLITPHVAWASVQARTRLLETCVQNIQHFIAGTPQNML